MTRRSDHRRSAPPAPLVWKFGGTSLADHDRLRAAADRMVAAQRSGRGVVAVLSAMGRSTDELVRQAYAMSPRPPLRELDFAAAGLPPAPGTVTDMRPLADAA